MEIMIRGRVQNRAFSSRFLFCFLRPLRFLRALCGKLWFWLSSCSFVSSLVNIGFDLLRVSVPPWWILLFGCGFATLCPLWFAFSCCLSNCVLYKLAQFLNSCAFAFIRGQMILINVHQRESAARATLVVARYSAVKGTA